METVTSKLQETGQQLAKHGDDFVSRTREAGQAFAEETRDAGREIVVFLRSEVRVWRKFALQRVARVRDRAFLLVNVPTLERRLLQRIDGTLQTVEGRVQRRLTALSKKVRSKKGSKRHALARKGRKTRSLPAIAA